METIKAQVQKRIKEAMLAKDKATLEALRSISAKFIEQEKVSNTDLTDEEALKVLTKLAKQRKESLEIYQKNNRPELAEVEAFQLAVIEGYLPKQVSQDEVAEFTKGLIANGATTAGQIMPQLIKQYKGQPVDMKAASQVVASLLVPATK